MSGSKGTIIPLRMPLCMTWQSTPSTQLPSLKVPYGLAANVKKFGKFFIQAWGDDPTGGLGGGGRDLKPPGVTQVPKGAKA